MAVRIDADPYENDPARWGHSLANLAEILIGCLDASGAKSVAEVGAYAGDLTRILLDWAAAAGARVVAIDPTPHQRLIELSEHRPELELIREPSHEALKHVPLPDAVIIDGDHNYYTVSEELRLIGERAPGAELPLLMLHDIGWPHGRRDAYWTPERVPEEHRQPTATRPRLFPGDPGVVEDGMPMYSAARREGGPRNGVLTAVEDFLKRRGGLRLAVLPPFFGFGVVWHRDAPFARAVEDAVQSWDRNPVLERLEANRVLHLATAHSRAQKLQRITAAVRSDQTLFLGVPSGQTPLDAWIIQEIISGVRPDLIVETGTHAGGSTALWALLLEAVNPVGRVLTIDVEDRRNPQLRDLNAVARRVDFLQGSSTDQELVGEVAHRAEGRTVMAVLNSSGETDQLRGELAAYGPLISPGSYLIVNNSGAEPRGAIERFLEQQDSFERDPGRQRFTIAGGTGSFLRRVR
jgi:cephalosporin hydroxylase